MSPSPSQKQTTPALTKRTVKPNPLLQLQEKDCGRRRRRDLFLRRVRQDGEERKWEARGEQVLRMEFISRQKRWEAEQARLAAESTTAFEDGEMATGAADGQSSDADVVEQVLSQEDQELEALVSLLETEGKDSQDRVRSPTEYGSDDEDYDDIFMEVLNGCDVPAPDGNLRHQAEHDQEMDTSNG
ncbi:MAG: hypothetical protein M1830_006113 [Pleopsidium flavum]|nr:MAG: hypothetical protein M1830_006113 [Pleopsidium flavum]